MGALSALLHTILDCRRNRIIAVFLTLSGVVFYNEPSFAGSLSARFENIEIGGHNIQVKVPFSANDGTKHSFIEINGTNERFALTQIASVLDCASSCGHILKGGAGDNLGKVISGNNVYRGRVAAILPNRTNLDVSLSASAFDQAKRQLNRHNPSAVIMQRFLGGTDRIQSGLGSDCASYQRYNEAECSRNTDEEGLLRPFIGLSFNAQVVLFGILGAVTGIGILICGRLGFERPRRLLLAVSLTLASWGVVIFCACYAA